MKVQLRLDTISDVQNFTKICETIQTPIYIKDNANHCVSGKSMMGMLYSLEWKEIWCECETDIYSKIKDFVI
jgi:hypothetical protein